MEIFRRKYLADGTSERIASERYGGAGASGLGRWCASERGPSASTPWRHALYLRCLCAMQPIGLYTLTRSASDYYHYVAIMHPASSRAGQGYLLQGQGMQVAGMPMRSSPAPP